MTAYREKAAAEALVFVTFGQWLFAVDPQTGRRVWYQRVSTASLVTLIARIAVAGDRVVVGAGKEVSCFDAARGAEIWRAKSPVHVFALVVVEGVVVIGSDGETLGIDLADGVVMWHDPYKNLGTGPVTLAGGDAVSGPQPMGKGLG